MMLADPGGSILSEYMSFIGKTTVMHCVKKRQYVKCSTLTSFPDRVEVALQAFTRTLRTSHLEACVLF